MSSRYNRRSISLHTAPSVEPISLTEIKAFLRISGSDEDDVLTILGKSARESVELYTGRCLITQTWKLVLDGFPNAGIIHPDGEGVYDMPSNAAISALGYIDLPKQPIQSVTSITTYNISNTSSTFNSSAYGLDVSGGRIFLKSGYAWPVDLRDYQAVEVLFVAGYGADGTSVPSAIKQAILNYVSSMYESRGACEMPETCKTLLNQYRLLDHRGLW